MTNTPDLLLLDSIKRKFAKKFNIEFTPVFVYIPKEYNQECVMRLIRPVISRHNFVICTNRIDFIIYKNVRVTMLYSKGIKRNKQINRLIDDVYNETHAEMQKQQLNYIAKINRDAKICLIIFIILSILIISGITALIETYLSQK